MASECASCGSQLADGAVVCAREATRLSRRLRQAADLWPHLAETVLRLDRMGAPGRPGSGHEQPLPFNWDASDARQAIANTVSTWTRHVAEQRYPPRPAGPRCVECEHQTCERIYAYEWRMPPPATMPELMRWLAYEVDWLRHQSDALQALDELDDACALLWRVIDRRATRTRVAVGPCPEVDAVGWCAGRVWAIVPESDQREAMLACDGCGTTWGTLHWHSAGRRILARTLGS